MLISVIIPIYNTEAYLSLCLDSIINQTWRDIEIICVENGSTDNSMSILEAYSLRHKNLKIIIHPEGRQGAARNAGMREAKGKFIAFVDSDDLITPDMFEKMITLAEKNASNIVMCQKINFYDGEAIKAANSNTFITNYKGLNSKILSHIFDSLGPCNKLFSKKFIDENELFFLEDTFYEDQYFTAKAFLLCSTITITSDIFYFYRKRREGSVTFSSSNNWSDLFYVWENIMADFSHIISVNTLAAFMVKRFFELFNTLNSKEQIKMFKKLKNTIKNVPIESQILSKKERTFLLFVSCLNFWHYQLFLSLKQIGGNLKRRIFSPAK